jgi:hypothetical protein
MNRKKVTKIAAMIISFTLMLAMFPAVISEAKTYKQPEEVYYLTRKPGASGSTQYSPISLYSDSGYTKIKSVKSSKKNIAKVSGYSAGTTDNWDYDDNGKLIKSKYSSVHASFEAVAPGTTTLSFLASKGSSKYDTYTKKLTVKAYENPIKSLRITNTKTRGQKPISELKGGFSETNYENFNITKGGTIRLSATAAKGWKIKEIQFDNYEGSYDSDNSRRSVDRESGTGVAKMEVVLRDYNVNGNGNFTITMVNTKTKGELKINGHIGKKSAY